MESGVRVPVLLVDFHPVITTSGAKKVNMPASCNNRKETDEADPRLDNQFFFSFIFVL
jgi:hypothetical protein